MPKSVVAVGCGILGVLGCGCSVEEASWDGAEVAGFELPQEAHGCPPGKVLDPRHKNCTCSPDKHCAPGKVLNQDTCKCDKGSVCGDGKVSGAELCDRAIPAGRAGACPTECDDGDACTTDVLVDAETCTARCVHTPTTTPYGGDGCCPAGADPATDSDCVGPMSCGDGLVSAGELCDTGIPAGQPGSCPTACDDADVCTIDALQGAGTCLASCAFAPITAPQDGDGCCPPGANASNDTDCAPSCGDGVVSAGELCDTGVSAGLSGSCPTACDDLDACTMDTLSAAGTCLASCSYAPIASPQSGDGCCPAGANANSDSDCVPVCGNGVVEPGEQCDDGNTANGDGCSSVCSVEVVPPTAFRINSMILSDPTIVVNTLGCVDLTAFMNQSLNNSIGGDQDSDGLYDISQLLVFRPLAQGTPSSSVDYLQGACLVAAGTCDGTGAVKQTTNETNIAQGVCLAPGADHTSGLATNTPVNNCFVTDPSSLTVPFLVPALPLQDAQIAAIYQANPATGLTTGLLRGFLSKLDADALTIPATTPLFGGQPISAMLAGGACNLPKDLDSFNGQVGWFFYFNFTAVKVAYSE